MYKPSEYMSNAAANRNLLQVHNELCSILHKDPNFATREFKDALTYLNAVGMKGVLQPHDRRPFEPKSNWNHDYWALVVSDLMENFSEERVQHVREVGWHLYGKPAPAPAAQPPQPSQTAQPGAARNAPARTSGSSNVQFTSSKTGTRGRSFNGGSSGGYRGGSNAKKWIPIAATAGVIIAGVAAIGIKKAALIGGTIVVLGGAAILLRSMRR